MHTTDGGASWSESVPDPTLSYPRFRRVDFADTLHGLVLDGGTTAENHMLRTTDGGLTWTRQTLPGIVNDIAFPDPQHAWAVGTAGAILASSDGGETWTAQASGTAEMLTCVSFSDAENGWAVGDAGTVLRTTNGGDSWRPQDSGTTTDIDFLTTPDNLHGFAVVGTGWMDNDENAVICTSDGGATWARTAAQPPHDWIGDLAFVDAAHGWALGDDTVSRTSDGGATWQTTSVEFRCIRGSRPFAAADDMHVWLGCGDGLLNDSADGGATWTDTSAAFDENKAQRLAVAAPSCASGAPGTKVKLRLGNFPVGWTSQLSGYTSAVKVTVR